MVDILRAKYSQIPLFFVLLQIKTIFQRERMKLFDQYNEVINDDVIDRITALSDESNGDGKKAFRAIYLTMVAGLVRRSTSNMSTNMLISQLKKSAAIPLLNDFDISKDTLDKKKTQAFIDLGNKNISQVFPAVKSPLLSLVTTYAGTGKKETMNYTGFVTNMLVQFLLKNIDLEKLRVENFSDFLKSHHEALFRDSPQDLLDKMIPALGMHELRKMKVSFSKKDESSDNTNSDADELDGDSEEGFGFNKRYLWLALGILGILAVAYLIYQNKDSILSEDEPSVGTVYEDNSTIIAALDSNVVADSTLINPSTKPESDFDQFAKLATDSTKLTSANSEVNLPSLKFDKGSTEFKPEKSDLINQLVDLMKQNQNLQIQIIGCDSGNDSQVALKRAFNLKRSLQGKGISSIRIDAISNNSGVDNIKIRIVSK